MMSPRKQAQAAFAAATLFLLLSGVAAGFFIDRLRSTRNWVNHTYEVQNALAQVNTVVSRAGRLRAEYVDSGDPEFLREYKAVLAQVPQALSLVRNLTPDNPSQQANCTQLEALTGKRVQLMQQAVDLRQTDQTTLERQYDITRQIVATAAEQDALLQRMQNDERVLLNRRNSSAEQVFWWTVAVLLGALVVSLSLFFINYRLLNAELEARLKAEDSLRSLSARLLRLQDEERRKFARELHDSLGQYLAGLKMLLSSMDKQELNSTLTQCLEIVDRSIAETRTISHLLHPPLLDDAGLKSAVSWYVEGFSQRSGVQIDLKWPEELGRLSSPIELVLFRTIQEALTNIHRHASAARAEIKLLPSRTQVQLSIRDSGRGMSPDMLERFHQDAFAGVGLAGMRERIRELNGHLEIESNDKGTLIRATLPLYEGALQTEAPGTS
jgi:signal transduction histidine kinase